MRIKPTPARRNVVLDIETVPVDPTVPDGALSAITGRIVCISILIDDGQTISEQRLIEQDEKHLVEGFWDGVRRTDLLIGYNIYGFDLPFIRQRSWVLGVRPSRRIDLRRFYSQDFLDLLQVWTNWGATRYPTLDAVAGVMDCGQKTGHGPEVARWWANGDLGSIARYCSEDVRLAYRLFHRLMFLPVPNRFATLEGCTAARTEIIAPPLAGPISSPQDRLF